jgi:hypothetical protein
LSDFSVNIAMPIERKLTMAKMLTTDPEIAREYMACRPAFWHVMQVFGRLTSAAIGCLVFAFENGNAYVVNYEDYH